KALETHTVTVAGRGAKLIGAAVSAELSRGETLETVVEGFFPSVPPDAEVQRGRAALFEFGLPYASDPAITRHLAEFLRRHGGTMPDAVLFNGGALKAAPVRERILDVLTEWRGGTRPHELSYDRDERSEARSGGEPALPGAAASSSSSLDLAVARGAAYY